jgi:two-component system cell cycle sensor histidine kinase/response regulator CckA
VSGVRSAPDAPALFTFPGAPRGTETILVTEDEPSVLRLITSVLELSGYEVVKAAGAEAALAISEAHPGPIHLLLTDVDMPVMNGRELAQRLRSSRPETRILYMSGREDDEIIRHGVQPGGTLFLPKPFTPYGLTWKVREVLDDGYWGTMLARRA